MVALLFEEGQLFPKLSFFLLLLLLFLIKAKTAQAATCSLAPQSLGPGPRRVCLCGVSEVGPERQPGSRPQAGEVPGQACYSEAFRIGVPSKTVVVSGTGRAGGSMCGRPLRTSASWLFSAQCGFVTAAPSLTFSLLQLQDPPPSGSFCGATSSLSQCRLSLYPL